MSLCEGCKKIYDYRNAENVKNHSWIHCHHNGIKEKHKCDVCLDGTYSAIYIDQKYGSVAGLGIVSEYCPKCGRKLKKEGKR